MAKTTKAELVALLAEKTGENKTTCDKLMTALGDVLTDELKAGRTVPLAGLGALKIVKRKARKGRNPQTGLPVDIQASTSVKLQPGKAIKNVLND